MSPKHKCWKNSFVGNTKLFAKMQMLPSCQYVHNFQCCKITNIVKPKYSKITNFTKMQLLFFLMLLKLIMLLKCKCCQIQNVAKPQYLPKCNCCQNANFPNVAKTKKKVSINSNFLKNTLNFANSLA